MHMITTLNKNKYLSKAHETKHNWNNHVETKRIEHALNS